MKKVLKKGLLFFKKWNIMWQMSAKGMKDVYKRQAVHHPHMQAAGKLPGMKKVYIDISIEQGICQRT